MQCGAILAGKADRDVEKIKRYGEPAGLAFQIKDDILDCIATEAELGKSIGNDVREGTKTIILWHAVHNSDSATMNRLKEIYMLPRKLKTDADVAFVLNKFNELGSVAFAEKEAQTFSEKAAKEFDKITVKLPDGPAKQIARSGIVHTVQRKK
jgi:geranylgeranyl pyrophosphate synthase